METGKGVLTRKNYMNDLTSKTPEELVNRQKLLESEIAANEEENNLMQSELNGIYAEQDRRRK